MNRKYTQDQLDVMSYKAAVRAMEAMCLASYQLDCTHSAAFHRCVALGNSYVEHMMDTGEDDIDPINCVHIPHDFRKVYGNYNYFGDYNLITN